MTFKSILVLLDGSRGSRQSAEVAASIASGSGARLTLCFIVDEGRLETKRYLKGLHDLSESSKHVLKRRKVGERLIQLVRDSIRRQQDFSLQVEGKVLEGDPTTTFLALARKGDYDLIVLPIRDDQPALRVDPLVESLIESRVKPVLTVPYSRHVAWS